MKRAADIISEPISAKRAKVDCAVSATKIQAAWRGYNTCAKCVAPHLRGMLRGKTLLRELFGCLARAGISQLEFLQYGLSDFCVDEVEISYRNSLSDINDVVLPHIGMRMWNRDSPTFADTFWQAKHALSTFDMFSSHKLCKDWVHSVLRTVKSRYFVHCEKLAQYAQDVYNANHVHSANSLCDDLCLYLLSAFTMPFADTAVQNIQRVWRGFAVRMVHPMYKPELAIYKPRAEKMRLETRIYNKCKRADEIDHSNKNEVREWLITLYLHLCQWNTLRNAPMLNMDKRYNDLLQSTYHGSKDTSQALLDFAVACVSHVFSK